VAGSRIVSPHVDLVLHIGTGKTGTTSIQTFLHRNRQELAERRILYPRSPGKMRHVRVSLSVLPDRVLERTPTWHRQGFASSEAFRVAFQRELETEIAEAGLPRVILSDEALYGAPYGALDHLRLLTDRIAATVRLVVYLRRQDDHLVSRYQQLVKAGETRRLVDRVQTIDFSGTYDYRTRLQAWQRAMDPTCFVVRRFERASFTDGSLHQDFLDAAGVAAREDELHPVRQLNESLDAEAVELLRILNLYRVEHEGARVGLIDNRKLVVRLRDAAAAAPGPGLTLPPHLLDEFMAQWEESNRAVARDFLGERDGELFRSPRKDRNTTSEQVLDPARVDHYLRLLELPEELHPQIRRIAVREAAPAG
jgi:hypothetical protein